MFHLLYIHLYIVSSTFLNLFNWGLRGSESECRWSQQSERVCACASLRVLMLVIAMDRVHFIIFLQDNWVADFLRPPSVTRGEWADVGWLGWRTRGESEREADSSCGSLDQCPLSPIPMALLPPPILPISLSPAICITPQTRSFMVFPPRVIPSFGDSCDHSKQHISAYSLGNPVAPFNRSSPQTDVSWVFVGTGIFPYQVVSPSQVVSDNPGPRFVIYTQGGTNLSLPPLKTCAGNW